jgi:hypothetical protein
MCDQHPDRFDCPDSLIHYSTKFREYGLIVHDGGSSTICIRFLPLVRGNTPEVAPGREVC